MESLVEDENEKLKVTICEYTKKKSPAGDRYLIHNDIATTRTYIMNNQGKQKTSRQIVNALSEMNGNDVLMGTHNLVTSTQLII